MNELLQTIVFLSVRSIDASIQDAIHNHKLLFRIKVIPVLSLETLFIHLRIHCPAVKMHVSPRSHRLHQGVGSYAAILEFAAECA